MHVQVRRHISSVLPTLLSTGILFFFLSVLFLLIYRQGPEENMVWQILVAVTAILLGLDPIITYLDWMRYSVTVTPHRITETKGLIRQVSMTWDLTGNHVELRQSIFDRPLDIGTIILHSKDERIKMANLERFSMIRSILSQGQP